MKYVLACYNGGYNHVRDAMALARKNGRNPYSWDEVSHYVLLLSNPAYYRDPVVRYGYMRGSETVGYVSRILERWNQYCSVTHGFRVGIPPQKAKHRNKYR
jgi:membrane-bound lytic murein transglycosylase F